MKEISFKKLKKIQKNKINCTNYGAKQKRLLVKNQKGWTEQEDKAHKNFKLYVPLNKPASELIGVRKNTLNKYKIAMAYLAKRILVDQTLTDYQQTLIDFLSENCPLVAMSVRKLAVVTIMEIFHEILPEQKIVEIKKGTELSEDVRLTYKREEIILKFYMKYLKMITENLTEAKKKKSDVGFQSLVTTMIGCLADLFMKHPKFNYYKDLLSTITPYLNSHQKETREKVFTIFIQLLKSDETGEMSLMIIKSIYTVIMKLKLEIHEDVVKVLYHLRLEHLYNIDNIRFEKKKSSKDMTHQQLLLKKMQRKKGHAHYSRKQRKEYQKDLYKRENKWLEGKDKLIEQQEKNNTETLQLTLGIYFLVLKRKPKPLVISSVFEGLARYAHLINIEFFIDLLKVMDEFFTSYRLSTTDQLYCIKTVFNILNVQSESLAIDPYRFYIHFYNVFESIPIECSLVNIQITIDILELLFKVKKTSVMSLPRVLALMKRYSAISCNMPNHTASLMVMSTVSKYLVANSFNEVLLENDQQGWPGKFTMANKEPDTANAGATALFELYLLQKHYHPHVRQFSESMIKGDIYNNQNGFTKRLIMKSSKDINNDYNIKRGIIVPEVPCPDEAIKIAKKQKSSGDLPLANLELYEHCMEVMENSGAPPSKKLKTNSKLMDLDFNFLETKTEKNEDDMPDYSNLLLGESN